MQAVLCLFYPHLYRPHPMLVCQAQQLGECQAEHPHPKPE